MKYSELQHILSKTAGRDEQALSQIVKTAAAIAEQNIRQKQEEEAYISKLSAARRASMKQRVRAFVTKVSAVDDALAVIEEGGDLPPEIAEELPGLVEEADAEEEALVDALLEAEDITDEGAEALLDQAADDPELAAELIEELDGIEVEPEEVEALSDAVAEAVIADNEGDGSAKAAAAINFAQNWLNNAAPVARLIVKESANRKAYRYLTSG